MNFFIKPVIISGNQGSATVLESHKKLVKFPVNFLIFQTLFSRKQLKMGDALLWINSHLYEFFKINVLTFLQLFSFHCSFLSTLINCPFIWNARATYYFFICYSIIAYSNLLSALCLFMNNSILMPECNGNLGNIC